MYLHSFWPKNEIARKTLLRTWEPYGRIQKLQYLSGYCYVHFLKTKSNVFPYICRTSKFIIFSDHDSSSCCWSTFKENVAIVPLSVCRQRVVGDQKMSLASLLSSRSFGVLHLAYFKAFCCFDTLKKKYFFFEG